MFDPGEGIGEAQVVIDFSETGLGLEYGTVRLVRSDPRWSSLAQALAASIRSALSDVATDVQHIGSSAVPGLLAKPIIDLAIGVVHGVDVSQLVEPMADLGWIYRGDGGANGGWVFVMEGTPWHRVAHAHGVEADGGQWRRYVEFRDLLLRSPTARQAYTEAKQRLAEAHPREAGRYMEGKGAIVQGLLTGNAKRRTLHPSPSTTGIPQDPGYPSGPRVPGRFVSST